MERLLTPVFWPGEFHGLDGPWGCKELDTTEQLLFSLSKSYSHQDSMVLAQRQKYRSIDYILVDASSGLGLLPEIWGRAGAHSRSAEGSTGSLSSQTTHAKSEAALLNPRVPLTQETLKLLFNKPINNSCAFRHRKGVLQAGIFLLRASF